MKLRKFVAFSSRARRYRRRVLNIQITFLVWLAESIGFLIIFLGTFILGHASNVFNFFMQTLTLVIYFIFIPSVFLLNDFDTKSKIVDSSWYQTFLASCKCNYIEAIDTNVRNNHDCILNVPETAKENNDPKISSPEVTLTNEDNSAQLFVRIFKITVEEDENVDENVVSTVISNRSDVVVIDLEQI